MHNLTFNGRYSVLQQLGAGGFGLTYLAEDLQIPTRPRCVVKHLRPQAADEETMKLANRLFQQEAEILYRLGGHPKIPSLIAHFKERGEFYLVQEFVEGHTLDREFTAGKKYNQKEIIQFLGQMLEILSFVHSQKVIHRDIKPANIIRRSSDGNLTLIDFGAVKQVSNTPQYQNSATFSSITIGSLGYMPMEQMAGTPNFSSDLYALGLVTIQALTAIKPLDLPKNAATNEFVWMHKTQLSPELAHFISKLIKMDFRQRYFSANEALAALNAIASNIGFFQTRPIVQSSKVINVQPIDHSPQFSLSTSPVKKPEFVPPTLIVPAVNQPVMHYPLPRKSMNKDNGSKDAKIVVVGVVAILFFLGFLFVAGKILNFRWSSLNESEETARQTDLNTSSTPSFNLYNEAVKQAEEAQLKEKVATTKFEWEEIGNKYKRAYGLLSSIEQSSPEYSMAQEKIEEFKQKAKNADERAAVSPEAPTLSGDSETVPIIIQSSESPTPVPVSENTPVRIKLAMPAKPSSKNFLVYNADYGNLSLSRKFTSEDYNFTSSVRKSQYSSYSTSTVEISAGSSGIYFRPPATVEKLRTGTFQATLDNYERDLGNYTIKLDGFYCSQSSSNSFTINGIIYDELYQNVSFIDASFSISCGDRKVLGRVHYDAR